MEINSLNFGSGIPSHTCVAGAQCASGARARIAIDPGMSGAMAVCGSDGSVVSINCPDHAGEIVDLLRPYSDGLASAILEKVGPMPKQGISSTWKFAVNYSAWMTALYAMRIPFLLVTPQKWQKCVGGMPADKTDRKNAIKAYAAARYPHIRTTLRNSDALAILSVFDDVWRQ